MSGNRLSQDPMGTDSQSVEVAGFGVPVRAELSYRHPSYTRYTFRPPRSRARGHIFRISASPSLALRVAVDPIALSLDFTKSSTRPDVPERAYVGRPGLYLSSLVRDIAADHGFCLGLNGNNLGYWPNQFAVVEGSLKFKSVPGLFEAAPEDVSGPAQFLVQRADGRFEMRTVQLVSTVRDGSRHVAAAGDLGFVNGISGYPLLVRSCPVWDESRRHAWDPKLVVQGLSTGQRTRAELAQLVASAQLDACAWPRHAFALAGRTAEGNLVLVAVEEREGNEGGISLPGAAALMHSLGCTDAIVLGGKGDVQAVSSAEGPVVRPLLSAHDYSSSLQVDSMGIPLDPDLTNDEGRALERPIPCALVLCPNAASSGR